MKPAVDEMFPEGAGPYVDLDEVRAVEAMAGGRRASFSGVLTVSLLATILLPEFLLAGPVVQKLKGDVGDATEETAVAMALPRRLVRNRRNISWYKQHSDFWSWYKYFTDNGNTEAVQELDRVYLAYLQNKNRAEGRRSYKAYLGHLGDIYKACADSEDPNCVASATNRPKPEPKTPPKPIPVPVKACDPYRDPYCLYAAMAHAKSQPPPAPAPVKAPAPLYAPEDVECLQFHLRAAFGYKPSAGPLPSYAHLGCDPKDPGCKPQLFATAPEEFNDEHKDEPAAMRAAPPAPEQRSDPFTMYRDAYANTNGNRQASAPSDPASDPYAMYRQASVTSAPASDPYAMYRQAIANAQANDPNTMYKQANANANTNDPFAMFREAAASMHRRTHPSLQQQAPAPPPRYEESPQEDRHPLGPRGKTKDGYECYIGYDQECYPITSAEPRSGSHRNTAYPAEPYEPHLNADGSRNGVVEPSDPNCDPEYDTNCRLRRYQSQEELLPYANAQAEHQGQPEPSQGHSYSQGEPERDSDSESEPYQSGQEEAYGAYPPPSQGLSYGSYPSPQRGMPSFQDMLRGYGDQYPEHDDHRAYAADYSKK
ncbi:unnamed protein product [Coregonus sp. 'balchen']|nr:unnamed protein product [Coregonus sp. 'balchen']